MLHLRQNHQHVMVTLNLFSRSSPIVLFQNNVRISKHSYAKYVKVIKNLQITSNNLVAENLIYMALPVPTQTHSQSCQANDRSPDGCDQVREVRSRLAVEGFLQGVDLAVYLGKRSLLRSTRVVVTVVSVLVSLLVPVLVSLSCRITSLTLPRRPQSALPAAKYGTDQRFRKMLKHWLSKTI